LGVPTWTPRLVSSLAITVTCCSFGRGPASVLIHTLLRLGAPQTSLGGFAARSEGVSKPSPLRGTEGSNPAPSSGESANFWFLKLRNRYPEWEHVLAVYPQRSRVHAGCNLRCQFRQNWDISKAREIDRLNDRADSTAIAAAAVRLGCRSVAFTYNDPVIFLEYAIDTAKACHAAGLATVAVTRRLCRARSASEILVTCRECAAELFEEFPVAVLLAAAP
jgi:hypothetical protein